MHSSAVYPNKKGNMENAPLNWIVFELAFAKDSDKVSAEVSNYCAMLLEGLLHNIDKSKTVS